MRLLKELLSDSADMIIGNAANVSLSFPWQSKCLIGGLTGCLALAVSLAGRVAGWLASSLTRWMDG